ncbi:PREDICTED: uncharacterized protein LOC107337338 [Paramuricea clavata]|uniref:PREDICTED: uncharacterized protein LOC107337338 n=1 Tax=Paramuricea clavata TaxID=317549 RepID=A0A6S7GX72_PARCT|nr:PREDICTED: uncharacterized protein LOC107337338 [Paramuricea clavata]
MTEVTKEALNEAKKKRRCAKSSVTRAGNGLDYLLKNERPIPEVEESLANLEDLYKKLVEKHDEYIQLVDGDEEFAIEEEWIEDCQQRFMQIRIRTKDYLKVKSQGQFENETNPETGLVPNQTETTVSDNGQQEHDGFPGSGEGPSHQGQSPTHESQPPTHEGQPPTHEGQPPSHQGQPPSHQGQPPTHQGQPLSHQGQPPSHQGQPPSHQGQTPSHQGQPPTHQGQPPSHQGQTPSHQGQPPTHQGQEHNSSSEGAQSISNVQPVCGFKMEKPKMPRFSGDVREYSIFRDDFKHAIESRYSKRDAMTYLRACLQGKPLELIKGIEQKICLKKAGPSVGVASVENNTEAMLPVITVKISGKNNRHKQGNILLDSGAQISLICTRTAKNLDLKGKDVSITIRKVGGEEEVLATKVYQVPITSLESGAKFTVKAVGIPHISDDISNINIGEMAKGIGIPEVKIYRECGPIDMLIGIDHAYMHTGDSKKVGNVVARHSPLVEEIGESDGVDLTIHTKSTIKNETRR